MSLSTSNTPVSRSAEATRGRLLDAALEEFGNRGYDAVSTRDLAKRAEVNLAAIPYHYGGKEDLYMAVVENIVMTAQSTCGVTAEKIDVFLKSGQTSFEQGEVLISELVGNIVGFLVGTGRSRFQAAFVIRELMHPSKAFDLLYDGYMKRIHSIVTRLVATLIGEPPESQASILRAHALLGQIVFFGAGRELIRRRSDWSDFTQDHLNQISRAVTETFIASIRNMRSTRGSYPPQPTPKT